MADNLYWVSALVYAIVLTVFLINDIKLKKKVTGAEKDCRIMFFWVILFCLQDMIWGLCENHIIKGDSLFFISSTIFHFSTVITTFFWLKYILSFLGDKIKYKKFYLVLDGAVVFFEFVMVVVNFYKPMLFSIIDGMYYTEKYRTVTFFNQYIVYLLIGISTFILAIKENTEEKKRYYTVFYYSLAPIIAGAFQLLYPDAPFYSTGYFLGCIIVHVFIMARDRELYTRSEMIKSIADIYFSMHIIELDKAEIEPYLEPQAILDIKGKGSTLQQRINFAIEKIASVPYAKKVEEFVDLSTLSERMKGCNSISTEFVGKGFGWIRISFISILQENNIQKRVMLNSQIIEREKSEQIELIYKSKSDELTRLLNRRAYENEIETLNEKTLDKNLIYISMDVNGLKNINDSLGHSFGDELLVGATECMRNNFEKHGNVYRIGGDEFIAIIYIDSDKFNNIMKSFKTDLKKWTGKSVNGINVSCGYVFAKEFPDLSIREIAKLADNRMYSDKALFYSQNVFDRREQREFNDNLLEIFDTILKININNNSFKVLKNNLIDEAVIRNISDINILADYFIRQDYIYDNADQFISVMNTDSIKKQIKENNKFLKYKFSFKKNEAYQEYIFEFVTSSKLDNDKDILLCIISVD